MKRDAAAVSAIPIGSTEAKRAAIKLNARALARYIEARADDAWAGRLDGTWAAGRKVRNLVASIMAQLTDLAAQTRPRRASPTRRKEVRDGDTAS